MVLSLWSRPSFRTALWGGAFDRPLARYSHSFQEKSNCKTIKMGKAILPLRQRSSNEPGGALDEVGYRFCIVEIEYRQQLAFNGKIGGDSDDVGVLR